MNPEPEYRNRNYPEPPEPTPEELKDEIARVKSRVGRLEGLRVHDEPAIRHADWELNQRQIGMILTLVAAPFLILYLSCRR